MTTFLLDEFFFVFLLKARMEMNVLCFYGLEKTFTETYGQQERKRNGCSERGRSGELTRVIMWSLTHLRKKNTGGRKRGKTALPACADIFIQVNLI